MYLENLSLNETPQPNWMDYTLLFLHVTWEHITKMKLNNNLWLHNQSLTLMTTKKVRIRDTLLGSLKVQADLRLLLYVLFIRHLDSVKNKSFLCFTQKNFSHFKNCLSYTLIHPSLVPYHA